MKNLAIKSFITVALFLGIVPLYAQHQVSGRIVDESTNSPLESANVILRTIDSVLVTGVTSNQKGVFQIKNIPSGSYFITASFIGYSSTTISLNGLSKSVDLDDILLSEEANELGAVTVTASNVINKSDRLIIFTTEQQKANASNGINILTTMQLPRLTVNPLTNEVSLPGDESVQFCINGVMVTHSDIRAIQPKEIVRIEYYDNPGVRYGDAGAVINYILKREVAGGSVSMDLSNAVTTSFGDDQIAAKFNYKKSEFGVNYSLRYRNPTKMWGDEERTFNFEDGSSMQRFDKGIPGSMSENQHKISLNYNLLDNGKYYFNATLRHTILEDDKMRRSSQYTSLDPTDITNIHQGANSLQQLPSLDLYYMRNLKNKQTVVLNVVGTYINTATNQKYEERNNAQTITDIISDVEGKKYSVIGEGIYEKTFENSNRFTAGLKHTQAFANNEYTGTVYSLTKMDQTETYTYAEYSGKKNKLSYTGGIGLSRSWARQKGEDDYTFYTFRPKVTLQYDFSREMYLRLRGNVNNNSPSLSMISAVDQYIDTLQVMRGNPSLKPNLNYHTDLTYSYRKGMYGVNFSTSYDNRPNAIMTEIRRENNRFISIYNNQKNWQKINSELTLNAGPIKKLVMVSLTGGVNRYISDGNSYLHTYTNFYYRAQLTMMYKKFMGVFQAGSANDWFSGETMHGGEDIHMFMVMYNGGKFTAGVGIMLPFSDEYKRYDENRNSYSPSKMYAYANDFSRMLLLKFAWNFDFGRKVKSGSKRISNEDTDSGIMRTN